MPTMPLMMAFPAIDQIATNGNGRVPRSPGQKSLLTDSCRICRNEIIIRMENTRIPRGSSRRRPTGNAEFMEPNFCLARRLVTQIIMVHKKSKIESVRDAINESERVDVTAITFAIRSKMLADTFT